MVVKVSFNRNGRTPLSSPPARPLSQPRLGHMEVWGIFSNPDHGTKGGFQEPGLHDSPPGQDRDCLNPRPPWLPKLLSGPQGPGNFFSILSTEPLPKSYPVPLLVPPPQNNSTAARCQATGRKRRHRAQQVWLEEGRRLPRGPCLAGRPLTASQTSSLPPGGPRPGAPCSDRTTSLNSLCLAVLAGWH